MAIVCWLLSLASFAVIAWIILGYVVVLGRIPWGHPVRKIHDALARTVEPALRPIRSVLPPLRIGAGALDLSPLVLLIALQIVARIVC